jgi:hypothetical protein
LITRREDFDRLSPSWNALLAQDAVCPTGLDATGGFEWAAALIDAFLKDSQWLVAVAADEQGVAGILPLFWSRHRWPEAGDGVLAALTELNGGRNGFLLREGSEQALSAIMACLRTDLPGWDRLNLRLTSGSRSEALFESLCAKEGMRYVKGGSEENAAVSPYLMLPDDLDEYLRGFNPKFRQEALRRDRRIREQGRVQMRVFTRPEEAAELWAAIEQIERLSWKEEAGSSLTASDWQERFHKCLLPHAAKSGRLACAVLTLDDAPVAYSLALCFEGVACGLKTSYVQGLHSFAPATVLARLFMIELRARGILAFDFMGACEAHKLRWTDSTYSRCTYGLFNQGIGGTVAQVRHRVGSLLKRGLART